LPFSISVRAVRGIFKYVATPPVSDQDICGPLSVDRQGDRRPDQGQSPVGHHPAGPFRPCLGPSGSRPRPRHLCRGRLRQDRPRLHRRRLATWRARGRRRRDRPPRYDGLAPAPALRRGSRNHRHRAPPMAAANRGGRFWPADRCRDALAHLRHAIRTAASTPRRPAPLAGRVGPRPCR
jgi:hypothetical protein